VAPIVSVARQVQVLAGAALVGAVPLTLGALLWIAGSVMEATYHGHYWSGLAGTGELLLLIGLICGLVMFVLAANGERWMPRGPVAVTGQEGDGLLPLASPEQQAMLADPVYPEPPQPPPAPAPQPAQQPLQPPPAQPPQPAPPYLPAEPYLPADVYPPGQSPPGQFPPDQFPPERPWPEPSQQPGWDQGNPGYPGPR
jgi:hypothetical protein